MNKLWIFGDNNSAIFGRTTERRFKYYKEYRNGIFPKTWSELLSKELNLDLKNMAVSGQSNYDIFDMVCKCIEQIKKDDVVIIGWGDVRRFRLVDDATNRFVTIRPNQLIPEWINNPLFLNGINIDVINSILQNRTNTEWLNEIYNWEIIINLFSKLIGFKIIYWTFDSTLNKSHYISTNDFRVDLVQRGAEDITLETNGKLVDDNFGEKGHLIQFKYFLNNMLYAK
jgi:hypothetical protein